MTNRYEHSLNFAWSVLSRSKMIFSRGSNTSKWTRIMCNKRCVFVISADGQARADLLERTSGQIRVYQWISGRYSSLGLGFDLFEKKKLLYPWFSDGSLEAIFGQKGEKYQFRTRTKGRNLQMDLRQMECLIFTIKRLMNGVPWSYKLCKSLFLFWICTFRRTSFSTVKDRSHGDIFMLAKDKDTIRRSIGDFWFGAEKTRDDPLRSCQL